MSSLLAAPTGFKRAPALGLLGLFLLALSLRLWRLGQFNSLVFDETYYVRFAVNYLQGTPFFDAHPPLGKYLIALGIAWVNPLAATLGLPGQTVEGLWLSPWSYRWMTALAGALLPPLLALWAYGASAGQPQLLRLRFSGLAGLLLCLEGLSLVESRFGLINLYWVGLGLLGQVCWQAALQQASPRRQGALLLLGGVAFGAAIAVKWNGAGFWLASCLLASWPGHGRPLRAAQLGLALISASLVPALTYWLLWQPHLRLTQTSFGAMHQLLWQVHQAIGEQGNSHPYCSSWYSWPLLLRPVAYFYRGLEASQSLDLGRVVVVVQGLGNPVLWWLATAAMVALAGQVLSRRQRQPASRWLIVSLLVSYSANWLPWMLVQRCTFLYHYLGAMVFSVAAIAWLLSRWLSSSRRTFRLAAWLLLSLIGLSFLFWLPLYLGLPLSPEALAQRWWLPSWV